MEEKSITYLLLLLSISVFSIIIVVVILALYIQKRNVTAKLQREKEKRFFDEQLLKSKIEISEENMRYIGRELHDNIGQLLSVAGMELKMSKHFRENDPSLHEVSELISKSITELRHLSKSLNNDTILNDGLKASITREIQRINNLNLLTASFTYDGNVSLSPKTELIIFRVLQEFISNTIKHAKAKNLTITIKSINGTVSICAKDDGCGFDIETVNKSNGLINIDARIAMINGKLVINSKPAKGTELLIELNSNES